MTQLQQLGDFLGKKLKVQQQALEDTEAAIKAEMIGRDNGLIAQINSVQNSVMSHMEGWRNEFISRDETLRETLRGEYMGEVSGLHAKIDGEVSNLRSECKAYTDTAIANLVDSAPETMNTLSELAAAIEANETVLEAIQEVANNHTHANATTVAAGFMSAAYKTALDNVGSYAQLVAAFNAVVGAESPLYESDENNPPAMP